MRAWCAWPQRPDGRGGTLGDDPRLAEAIGRLATDTAAMRCLGHLGFAKSVRGEMSPEHMVLKLFSSESEQRACLLGQRMCWGLEGLDLDGPGPEPLHRVGPRRTSTPARSDESAMGVVLRRRLGRPVPGVRSRARSPAARRRSSATSWRQRVLGLPRGYRPLPTPSWRRDGSPSAPVNCAPLDDPASLPQDPRRS